MSSENIPKFGKTTDIIMRLDRRWLCLLLCLIRRAWLLGIVELEPRLLED
jgi:hypothetical protein